MVNGMLVSWADIVVLIGGVPVTGITGVEYGDSRGDSEQVGRRSLPCWSCQRENHSELQTDTVPGRGAGTLGAESDGPAPRPAPGGYHSAVYPRQRAAGNRQNPQYQFFGKRPQMERGGHRPGGGTSRRALTHRMGQSSLKCRTRLNSKKTSVPPG